jgi:2,3-dihydroxybenzoate decarboxylase
MGDVTKVSGGEPTQAGKPTQAHQATSVADDTAIPRGGAPGYLRIATEEAFATRAMLDLYRKLLAGKSLDDPGFTSLWGFYLGSPSPRATAIIERLQDLGERRIADMDDTGIDLQLLSLTGPGVQVFDAATANSVARDSNDELAAAIARYPTRFAGLAAAAPQDPATAAKEIERGVRKLGFKGVIINSHTHGEYLDDAKFWPLFEACEALDVPIYLHPQGLSKGLVAPFLEAGLDGAIYGFGVETGLHLLRIIVKGVFDRFPRLQIVVGHCGEALPFWMYRLDYMHGATVASKRYAFMKPLERRISDYLRENVYVTNSGVAWEPAIMFCRSVVGADRVMYAMDYPYQFVKQEVVVSDRLPLTLDEKKQYFQTNAERVFKL